SCTISVSFTHAADDGPFPKSTANGTNASPGVACSRGGGHCVAAFGRCRCGRRRSAAGISLRERGRFGRLGLQGRHAARLSAGGDGLREGFRPRRGGPTAAAGRGDAAPGLRIRHRRGPPRDGVPPGRR
ncbi:unnamed protein product, partial [Ectocarpus sp. 8 AP-2014]